MLRAFWVVVIRADRPDVIARLRRLLAGAAWVQIVVDRRRADRRRTAQAAGHPEPERRRADRRRTSREASGAPYRLIQSAEGYQVLQSQSRASVRCLDCGVGLEFDMPGLNQVPVQLDVTVFHPGRGADGGQHVVETQARQASGHPFLASRVVARRQAAVG
jgi:hypothetical protein